VHPLSFFTPNLFFFILSPFFCKYLSLCFSLNAATYLLSAETSSFPCFQRALSSSRWFSWSAGFKQKMRSSPSFFDSPAVLSPILSGFIRPATVWYNKQAETSFLSTLYFFSTYNKPSRKGKTFPLSLFLLLASKGM